jgi:hypothetical protein
MDEVYDLCWLWKLLGWSWRRGGRWARASKELDAALRVEVRTSELQERKSRVSLFLSCLSLLRLPSL